MLMRAATVVQVLLAGLVLCFIACFILLVITPLMVVFVCDNAGFTQYEMRLAADSGTRTMMGDV